MPYKRLPHSELGPTLPWIIRENYEALLVRLWAEARALVSSCNAAALKVAVDDGTLRQPMPILRLEERTKSDVVWLRLVMLKLKKGGKFKRMKAGPVRFHEFTRYPPRKKCGLIYLTTLVNRAEAYSPEQLDQIAKMIDTANGLNAMIVATRAAIYAARELEEVVPRGLSMIRGNRLLIDGLG